MSTRRRHRASAIRAQLAECIAAARREGYTGTDAEYEYTQEDLNSIVAFIIAVPIPPGNVAPAAGDWRKAPTDLSASF